MNLNFLCQFNETGIGRHCESAFRGIAKCKPDGWNLNYFDFTDQVSLRRLLAQGQSQASHTITFMRLSPDFLARVQGRKIGWLFFESDRLPETWLRQMDAFDQLWMPTLLAGSRCNPQPKTPTI